MRDAVAAIQAALNELLEARKALPEDFAVELDHVIEQTRILLESLGGGVETAAQDEPAER
jgi:hypothetical protein